MNTKLARVCEAFQLPGTFTSYEEITIGNVNRTYLVNLTRDDGAERTYMVQALNTFAFKDPVAVMDNVDRITKHIRDKKPGYTALKFYHIPSGESYFLDGPFFWRVFNYIPSVTHNICTDLEVVRNAGSAFGEFQTMLADFDPLLLHETIANFHNTPDRYRQLEEAVAADPVGRVAQVQEEPQRSCRCPACPRTAVPDSHGSSPASGQHIVWPVPSAVSCRYPPQNSSDTGNLHLQRFPAAVP